MTLKLAILGLATTAMVAATALPAHAAAVQLTITVTPTTGGAYAMRLFCDPDGGVHPRPGPACDALRRVGGHVERLDHDPGPCTLQLDPVRVGVEGHWYGMPVAYLAEFTNPCTMRRKLGPVAAQS